MLSTIRHILRTGADLFRGSAILVALLLGTFCPLARAVENSRDQVAAATANAIDSLRAQIGQIQLTRNVTVQSIIDRTHGEEPFAAAVARAQQIGGPRWLNSQTVQVQLEIPGRRIARALGEIVQANPKQSPITADRSEEHTSELQSHS